VGGEPAKFPSINTRSERLQQKPGNLAGRAIVPATSWLEMQKPSRTWYRYDLGAPELFGMAAVTQRGIPTGGEPVTCYSIIMQPARDDQAPIHDRMPLLIPASFTQDWLAADVPPSRELMDAALDAGREMTARVRATVATT
jgi:putative SOS response-associated peptidase YedK